jgi:hypothetical protein
MLCALVALAAAAPASAARVHGLVKAKPAGPSLQASAEPGDGDGEGEGTEESEEILRANEEFSEQRTLPADDVSPEAFRSAQQAAAALPTTGGAWTEVTNKPVQSDAQAFHDPVISNVGSGNRYVTGRMTALAADGNTIYAGAAGGGVWKSTNAGVNWKPIGDQFPSLSIGAVAINPADHSVWVGTGEDNTNSDAYRGVGIYRSADGGRTFQQVGGTQLDGHLIGRIAFDGAGHAYAATNYGVYRRDLSDALDARWQNVLKPGVGPYGMTFANDVLIRPGTGGRGVLASVAWRGGAAYNGFYYSGNYGRAGTWSKVNVAGDIDTGDIGRTTFAYSADGSKLYAIVQSPEKTNEGADTAMQGVFKSASGSPTGPWTLIADSDKLLNSGSGLIDQPGYHPGIQAWYNQFLTVDPKDADHVYVGLEEVFETRDGGATFTTPGPYWNFPFSCYRQTNPFACPTTPHSDQHGVAISNGRLYVGNDGGVYRRNVSDKRPQGGWTDLNPSLRTLQYYSVGAGRLGGGDAVWGGLQDNGGNVLFPGASQIVQPFGGDGGDTIVDPANGNRAVMEYTDLDMWRTENGGRSAGFTPAFTEFTPSCFAVTYTPDPCDPAPRFIAPFQEDHLAPQTHWIAGGEFVWETTKGFDTNCGEDACDWTPVHDTGGQTTALDLVGDVMYAGWCGGGCNPDGFSSGIDTNYGGTWHTVHSPVLPNRYVAGLYADPANAAHVYAVYNGFSRRWIPGGGTGHVFESTDGGTTWTDISGDLPDAPSDDIVLRNGKLTLATDIGVFTAPAGHGAATHWSVLGTKLPQGTIHVDLALSSNGSRVLDATHGRGIWSIRTP